VTILFLLYMWLLLNLLTKIGKAWLDTYFVVC
jgi:hypothetical protein